MTIGAQEMIDTLWREEMRKQAMACREPEKKHIELKERAMAIEARNN